MAKQNTLACVCDAVGVGAEESDGVSKYDVADAKGWAISQATYHLERCVRQGTLVKGYAHRGPYNRRMAVYRPK